MKMKSFLIPVLTLVLAGCANEELETLGGGGGSSPGVSSGQTVLFSNNTAVTIGDTDGARTRAMVRSVEVTDKVNDACWLAMDVKPDRPSNSVYIKSGQTVVYNKYEGNVDKHIFVDGTLVLNENYKAGAGFIYINEGGKLIVNTERLVSINVFNYGGEIEFAKKDLYVGKTTLRTVSDLDIEGKVTMESGYVYVGGNFMCAELVVNKDSRLRVEGDLNLTDDKGESEFGDVAHVCVEGALYARYLDLEESTNVHVGCKLQVAKKLELEDCCELTAEYIKSSKTEISGATVILREGGLADLGDLCYEYSRESALLFKVMGSGKAMITCNECELKGTYSLKDAIGSNFYFNYEKFYVYVTNKKGNWKEKEEVSCPGMTSDGCKVEIGTTLVNVATPNDYVEGGCNPGFTPDEVDPEPEPEPEPDPDPEPGISDDIELQIPTEIEREWFAEADDFAIRVNGRYEEEIILEGNATTLHGVKISESNLKVTLSGIENLPSGDEYTYELWVWVEEESWNTFTDAERKAWVSGDGDGTDITEKCTITAPEGYSVRKNVYAGLGGQKDTPYIKVSIHVVRD